MWEIILGSLGIMAVLGLILGLGLAYASKKFAVERDPRIDQVREILPGANCGACGFPGCDGFAAKVVAGEAPINGCPVGGAAGAAKVAAIMGVEAEEGEPMVAYVACQGGVSRAKQKYQYDGVKTCAAANLVGDGFKSCRYGCLGFGDCVRACSFGGIEITEDGVAHVNPDVCVACGQCIKECPKSIISLIPRRQQTRVTCKAVEKGKAVRETCTVGCIGCGLCVKNCKFDAIHLENNLPIIDTDKCTNCMVCVEKCPTHALYGDLSQRKRAVIDPENCVGCTLCFKACPFEAIEGTLKQKHFVRSDACKGCGACVKACRKDAIRLESRG